MADRPETPILAPDLGSGERPVRLVQWLVDVGSPVQTGDRLVELLVDGVLFFLPSPAEGKLADAAVPRDSTVHPGDRLGAIR